jgi:hypothetical protein
VPTLVHHDGQRQNVASAAASVVQALSQTDGKPTDREGQLQAGAMA